MGRPLPICYSAPARADLAAIYRYIARDNPVAAVSVVAAIEDTVRLLSHFPEKSRRTKKPGMRAVVLSQCPYIVFFRIRADELYVLHVLHAARRHTGFQEEQRAFARA